VDVFSETRCTSTITTTTATPTASAGLAAAAGATGTTAAAATDETTDTHQTSNRCRKKVPTKTTITEKPHTEEFAYKNAVVSCHVTFVVANITNCSTLPNTILDIIVQHTGWVCITAGIDFSPS